MSQASDLRREIEKIPLIDSHEHLPYEEEWIAGDSDFSSILGYVHEDLISAGMAKECIKPEMSDLEKWRQIQPFWAYVRYMGSGILYRRMLSLFFDLEDLDGKALPIIREKLSSLKRPGIYRQVLRDEHNIEMYLSVDHTIFHDSVTEVSAPLLYTANLAMTQKRSDISALEKISDRSIYSLQTYCKAVDTVLENGMNHGLVGLKWHKLAYLRDIDYPAGDASEAERCLNMIFRMPAEGGIASDTAVGFKEMAPFQNFIQNYLVQRAIDLDLPVQVHTGLPGASYGARISHTNPAHLADLFLRYPGARFDLLHAGYPYMRELTALVKLFPNVYINTSWFEEVSPRASRQFLREWLSSVPLNKIIAFGADQFNVLLTCAYAEIVRDNLAEILSDEIDEGNFSEEQALMCARRILRENAGDYFKLDEKWTGQKKNGQSETERKRNT